MISSQTFHKSFNKQFYQQYLTNLQKQIVQAIHEDEAVEALKEIQQKIYLIDRIRQIVEAVTQSIKAQNIIKLSQEIQSKNCLINQMQEQMKRINNSKIQKLVNIQQNQRHHWDQNNQQEENKNKMNKQQNEQQDYQKVIINLERQHKLRISQLTSSLLFLQQSNLVVTSRLQSHIITLKGTIKQWEDKYREKYQQKQQISTKLEQLIERNLEEQLKTLQEKNIRETFEGKINRLRVTYEKCKENEEHLQQNIYELQRDNQRLNQQVLNYQQEIILIKKINNHNHSQQNQNKASQNPLDNLLKIQISRLSLELEQKSKKIKMSQVKMENLKKSKHQTQLQFHSYKLQSQNIKFDLFQQLSQTRTKLQKQIRLVKEISLKEKQKIIEDYEQNIQKKLIEKQREHYIKIKQLKQQNQSKQIQINQLRKQIKIKQSLKKQKQTYEISLIKQSQQKENQLKQSIKQLERQLQTRFNTQTQNFKQQGKKLEVSQKQTQHQKGVVAKCKKEIEQLRRQNEKLKHRNIQNDDQHTKQTKIQKLNKYEKESQRELTQIIKQQKHQIIIISQQIKGLQKEIKNLTEINSNLKQEYSNLSYKHSKSTTTISTLQAEISNLKLSLSNGQSHSKQQMNVLHLKFNDQIQQTKLQLKRHYQQLLKNRQQKINELKEKLINQQNKQKMKELKNIIEQLKQEETKKVNRIEQLYNKEISLNDQLTNKQTKIYELITYTKELESQLSQQKQQNINLRGDFQSRNYYNQLKFKQFKHEFYIVMKQVLSELKLRQKQIRVEIMKLSQNYNLIFKDLLIQFNQKSNKLQDKYKRHQTQIRSYYENQIILKLKIEQSQIIYDYEKQQKQKAIQFMSLISNKQHELNLNKERFQQINIQNNQLTTKNQQFYEENNKLKAETLQMKQILAQMNQKVFKLQKQKISSNHYIAQLQRKDQENHQKIIYIERTYQQKLEISRTKYIQQNQKLFHKYQKQFDKLIHMNSKTKNMNLSSTIILSNMVAPTKQTQKVLEKTQSSAKLDNLKKQILLQKKKLQVLDMTTPKISKIPTKLSKELSNIRKF